jgi:hypothetical protein
MTLSYRRVAMLLLDVASAVKIALLTTIVHVHHWTVPLMITVYIAVVVVVIAVTIVIGRRRNVVIRK